MRKARRIVPLYLFGSGKIAVLLHHKKCTESPPRRDSNICEHARVVASDRHGALGSVRRALQRGTAPMSGASTARMRNQWRSQEQSRAHRSDHDLGQLRSHHVSAHDAVPTTLPPAAW